jgi:hypothetical protein
VENPTSFNPPPPEAQSRARQGALTNPKAANASTYLAAETTLNQADKQTPPARLGIVARQASKEIPS